MQYIKTQAFPITDETYSLAVAILPPIFATIPISQTIGCLVVINQLTAKKEKITQLDAWLNAKEPIQKLIIESIWMSEEMFHEMYDSSQTHTRVVLSDVIKID